MFNNRKGYNWRCSEGEKQINNYFAVEQVVKRVRESERERETERETERERERGGRRE